MSVRVMERDASDIAGFPAALLPLRDSYSSWTSRVHAGEPSLVLTREQASAFARLALKGIGKEYPNKPEHVMAGPADVKAPMALHPAFYGSYDWHSSVHGHWMLVRLLRSVPRPAGGARDPRRPDGPT